MKPAPIIFASAMLALAAAAPANAQQNDPMKHSSMGAMKMSAADMNMMMSCKRMSKTAMMKNKRCSDMMKMHPDMMNMSAADMSKMSACMKMSDREMMADKRCASLMEMHHNMSGTMGAMETNGGVSTRTSARQNSQGSMNASDTGLERANENSALSSAGMMGNVPPCTRQRTDGCMQMNERGMRTKATARPKRR